jgi:hypothetical protein
MAAGGLLGELPRWGSRCHGPEAAGRLDPSSMVILHFVQRRCSLPCNEAVDHQGTSRYGGSANHLRPRLTTCHPRTRCPGGTRADLRTRGPAASGPGVQSGANGWNAAGPGPSRSATGYEIEESGSGLRTSLTSTSAIRGRPMSAESPAGVSGQHFRGRSCRE